MKEQSAFAGKLHQIIVVFAVCALAVLAGPAHATDYYVATYGSDNNSGTSTNQSGAWATLAHAVSVASAGDTIYMRGGTYNLTAKISLSQIGTAANPYRIRAYAGESPRINCAGVGSGTDGFGITGAYWQLYGLEIYGAPHNAIRIQGNNTTAGAGSHNTFEFCSFHDCGNTGFSIGASTTPTTYLAGSNLVLNCDAYRNFDPPVGGNADGFSVKYQVGPDNTFRGCRSWENSDDGWDLFGAIGRVLIDTCWTWRNGSNVWGAAYNSSFAGNGNGFKLGGNYVATHNRLVRSIAYQNVGTKGGKGIDENNNTGGLLIDHNVSWGNRSGDIILNTTNTIDGYHIVRNNLVLSTNVGIQTSAHCYSNSWQVITPPDHPDSNDFLSIDTSYFAAARQADGSLPVTPLVHLVPGDRLVDKGVIITDGTYNGWVISNEVYSGAAPDVGAYETAGGAPVAAFTGAPTSGTTPLAVTFTDSSTGDITNRNWTFGDGATSNTTATTMNHTYNAGTYSVMLIVSGSNGSDTNTKTSYIVATNPPPPVASFTGIPTSGSTPLSVTFTDSSTGSITNRFWNFGDGSMSNTTATTMNHSYAAGTYTVTLTVSGIGGTNTYTRTSYIVSANPPVASFTGIPTSGSTPLAVTFTDSSTGSITNRFWNFGDSSTTNTTTNSLSHTYNAGTYTVSLTVSGTGGSSNLTRTSYIVATNIAPPTANFTASSTNGTAPLAVTFTDASTGSITNRFWDFGDGNTTNFAAATNPLHTYAPGVYSVTLTVSGPGGDNTLVSNNLITVVTAFQAWQQQFFSCTSCPQADASADPDGDGQNNLAEFLSGTNPTNNLSVLRIVSASTENNDVQITWTTAGGRTNVLQVATGDTDGGYATNFTDLSTRIIVPGSGDTTASYLDAGGATNIPFRYYRIRLVP